MRIETFSMARQMARGIRTVVGLSCLSLIHTYLDTLTDKKKSPLEKKGELQIHCMLGRLATYCPKTYNAGIEVTNDLPLLCKIYRVEPSFIHSRASMSYSRELMSRLSSRFAVLCRILCGEALRGDSPPTTKPNKSANAIAKVRRGTNIRAQCSAHHLLRLRISTIASSNPASVSPMFYL